MAKRKRKYNFKKFSLKRLVYSAAGTAVVLGAVWLVHFLGNQPMKDFIESNLVTLVDFVRESDFANPELVFVLDQIVDQLPYVHGQSFDAGVVADASDYFVGGVPVAGSLRLLKNSAYWVGYDEDKKNPAWCAYTLTYPKSFETAARPGKFVEDTRTRSRVSHDDYTGTGFDRGHLAPNQAIGVCYGSAAQLSTFYMSNIVPQYHAMNAGVWKDLEQRVLRRYTRQYEQIWVICGPIYGNVFSRFANGSGVAIPEACYLILVDFEAGKMRTLSFIVPNDKNVESDPKKYIASIDEIEARTGIDFFAELSAGTQDAIESYRAKTIW